MMNKKVSVVLPVYNGEKYLASSIESVLRQSYENIELLIVNDCSTDSTESIILSYASKDARIIYLRNDTNMKLPASLNRGFQSAHGDYLTWTSDDNLYCDFAIEKMVQFLEANPDVGMVYCDYETIDENGAVLKKHQVEAPEKLIFHNIIGACFLYTRQVKDAVGEYDTKRFLVEDYDYWFRIYLSFPIAPLHECLYQYRFHSTALTITRKKEIETALLELLNSNLRKLERSSIQKERLFLFFDFLMRKKKNDLSYKWKKICFSIRHPSYIKYILRRRKKQNA